MSGWKGISRVTARFYTRGRTLGVSLELHVELFYSMQLRQKQVFLIYF